MRRKKMVVRGGAAVLAVAVAACLAGCSNPLSAIEASLSSPSIAEARGKQMQAAAPAVTTPTIIKNGTLTVGLDTSSSAPMCITGSDGTFQGYDVDMAYAIADQLGLTVEFVGVSGASSALGQTCDIVMDASSNASGSVTVVGAYAEDAVGFFHKGGEGTVDKGSVMGKTIGVQDGSVSRQLLKRSDLEARQESFTNLNDAFDALEQGIVDYVLCDAFSGAYLQAAYSDISFCGSIDVPSSVGVGVAAANTELQNAVQQAVDKVCTNGVSDIIRAKWLGGMGAISDSSQISGISISAGTVAGSSETAETSDGASGVQDGSTAGANAADVG